MGFLLDVVKSNPNTYQQLPFPYFYLALATSERKRSTYIDDSPRIAAITAVEAKVKHIVLFKIVISIAIDSKHHILNTLASTKNTEVPLFNSTLYLWKCFLLGKGAHNLCI